MSEPLQSAADKLSALRAIMLAQGLDAYIVPRTDEYQGEFVAPYAERLSWLTGFTGSAGVAIVLADKATVLTDGRYTLQLAQQTDTSLYEGGNSIKTPPEQWLATYAPKGAVIGYDPRLHTMEELAKFEDKALELKAIPENLIDEIWTDQPDRPCAPVEIFPENVAGLTHAEKRAMIADKLKVEGAQACLLTRPDSIGWLLNIRGDDTPYTPLVLSSAVIKDDGRVLWFVEGDKISDEVRAHLGGEVEIISPDEMAEKVETIEGAVAMDFARTPIWLASMFEEIADMKDPCLGPRALKTAAEQKAVRSAHIKDGVALARFMHWLSTIDPAQETEISISNKLEGFRKAEASYRGPSFPTIAGFAANGAVIHYRPAPETNLKLAGDGLLLVDSGGQYAQGATYGTTDITRTMAIGTPTAQMQRAFTRVLQGHIAVARAHFPTGTKGAQIDALARTALWNADMDYAHGTGHGVGCYGAVHEEAASISPRSSEIFAPGMLISNEPGYYKTGEYGIRIENLVLVGEGQICPDTGTRMLHFDTVSLAPIDRRLVVKDMLSKDELAWLNGYHTSVREALTPHLPADVAKWLKVETAEI